MTVTDVSTTKAEVIIRVKGKSCFSVECCKSGSWKLIGQFCGDGIGCKTQVYSTCTSMDQYYHQTNA